MFDAILAMFSLMSERDYDKMVEKQPMEVVQQALDDQKIKMQEVARVLETENYWSVPEFKEQCGGVQCYVNIEIIVDKDGCKKMITTGRQVEGNIFHEEENLCKKQ